MPGERRERCDCCRFYDGDVDEGECRRHAPRFLLGQVKPGIAEDALVAGVWPAVSSIDWCGDFEANEART